MRISDWSSDVCSSDLRLQVGDGTLGSGLVGRRHLVAGLRQGLLGGVDQRLRMVLRLDQGAALLVLLGVSSASFTICSISASLRPLEAWMRMVCSLPVALSFAPPDRKSTRLTSSH